MIISPFSGPPPTSCHIGGFFLSHIIGNLRRIHYTSKGGAYPAAVRSPKFQSAYVSFSSRVSKAHKKLISMSDSLVEVNRVDSRIRSLGANFRKLPYGVFLLFRAPVSESNFPYLLYLRSHLCTCSDCVVIRQSMASSFSVLYLERRTSIYSVM